MEDESEIIWYEGDIVEYNDLGCRFTARLTHVESSFLHGLNWSGVVLTVEGKHANGEINVGDDVWLVKGHSVKVSS